MPPDDGGRTGPPGSPAAGPSRWRIPFWAFQVLELGVAFLLATQSVHVAHGGLLVVAGVLLAVLALTADGPIGVLRVCGQRLHRSLVVVLAVAMGVVALVPASRPDTEGVLMIAFAVVALVYLATRTTVTPRGRRRRGRRAADGEPVIDATATVVTPTGDPPADAPPPGSDPDSALRRAGRTAGAASAAGRRAVDEHRPQVEDQVRRTLRGAGRLAGRLSGPKSQPADPPTDPHA
jgi:membrane protein implicated in regulation of membrane protease activity